MATCRADCATDLMRRMLGSSRSSMEHACTSSRARCTRTSDECSRATSAPSIRAHRRHHQQDGARPHGRRASVARRDAAEIGGDLEGPPLHLRRHHQAARRAARIVLFDKVPTDKARPRAEGHRSVFRETICRRCVARPSHGRAASSPRPVRRRIARSPKRVARSPSSRSKWPSAARSRSSLPTTTTTVV